MEIESERVIGPIGSVCGLVVWNNFLCSGSYNTIRVWNERGDCVKILEGHSDYVYCLTVWKNALCSGSADKRIRQTVRQYT